MPLTFVSGRLFLFQLLRCASETQTYGRASPILTCFDTSRSRPQLTDAGGNSKLVNPYEKYCDSPIRYQNVLNYKSMGTTNTTHLLLSLNTKLTA